MRRVLLIWAACVIATGASFSPAAEKPAKTRVPYNVLLITPDQMRADFMHTYGGPWPNTPNIDQFASTGTVFLHAYSAGGWTTPSFGSILTGLFPTVHGMTLPPHLACGPSVDNPDFAAGKSHSPPVFMQLSPHKPIIPDLLKPYDVTTAVDIANCWAIWDVLNRKWDSVKIIPSYLIVNGKLNRERYLTAPKTLSWAQQWLTAHRGQRFFFWVHFMEPHSPYNAPRQYDRFKTFDDFPNLYDDNNADHEKLISLAILGNPHAIRRLRQLYAAKILYVDHYIGELLETVSRLGLDKNTIIIFVSDHGELLFSHPKDFNTTDHRSVYDADLHVPLIIAGPGIPAGRRAKAIVGQYDLVPTILSLEGLPVPPDLDGKSLEPILKGAASQVHRYVYAEDHLLEPQYAIRDQRYSLIETMRTGNLECFDDLTDPGQRTDDCNRTPAEASKLKAALDRHIQRVEKQARSYPDWKNNAGLAVLEQRDSKALYDEAPKLYIVAPPSGGSFFQLEGQDWSFSTNQTNCKGLCYWVSPGANTDRVIWRSDTPFIGEYEISVWYGQPGQVKRPLATDANFIVRFKGGSLSYPLDENQNQAQWNVLGRFQDPVSVELTNQADGPVVADAVRFRRIGAQ